MPDFDSRPLPAAREAERAVLSCCLQDPANSIDLVRARLPEHACFFYSEHQRVYRVLVELAEDDKRGLDEIDAVTVATQLQRHDWLDDIGGVEYLAHLAAAIPTTARLEAYAQAVQDAYILRRLITACGDIASRCLDAEDDVPQLVDRIEQEVLAVSEMRFDKRARPLAHILPDALDFIARLNIEDDAARGIATGYPDLDRLITGLKPGDLFVLAARPGIGKTTLALNIAQNVAKRGAPVAVFSLEMDALQVTLRLLCAEARINLRDVRDGRFPEDDFHGKLFPAVARLQETAILIDDTPQISTLELRQKARRLHREHRLGLVIVDYLQLMQAVGMSKNANREQEVARMSADIKGMARELGVPVMLLCQLNRQAEQAGTKPRLSHLRESGAIEQDADIVALLHREREVEQTRSPAEIERDGVETELIVAKHRNGETGLVRLLFFGQYTRFESRSRVDDQDIPPGQREERWA